MSFNQGMDKQTVIHTYYAVYRILLSNIKELTTETCNNSDEYPMHYAKLKESSVKILPTKCFPL